MNAGRWYPTNTTLASGNVQVLAGTTTGYGNVNLLPQVWQMALWSSPSMPVAPGTSTSTTVRI